MVLVWVTFMGKYTDGQLKKVLSTLTIPQLEQLYRILYERERTAFARGKKEGQIFGTLSKARLIERFGKVGAKQRWRIVPDVFSKDDRDFLKELLGINKI